MIKVIPISIVLLLATACNQSNKQGERLYINLCSQCHMDNGSGLGNIIPSIEESLMNQSLEKITCNIQLGFIPDSIGLSPYAMPSFKQLSDVEISNLLSFLNLKWGNRYPILPNEIKKFRKNCK